MKWTRTKWGEYEAVSIRGALYRISRNTDGDWRLAVWQPTYRAWIEPYSYHTTLRDAKEIAEFRAEPWEHPKLKEVTTN